MEYEFHDPEKIEECYFCLSMVLFGVPGEDCPRVTYGKGMGKELRKANLTLTITRFFTLHSLQVCGRAWNAAAAFFEGLCVKTCVPAAASCATAYLLRVFGVQYVGCGILGLSLLMRLLALVGVRFPLSCYVLLVDFFATEWRCLAAAAAAWCDFSCGDAAAGALQYIFTLEDAFLLVVIIAIAFVGSWQQAAAARGCHTAFWAKATPRVDVGDTPKTMTTASPRCGLWLGNLDKVGKGQKGDKEKDEEKEVVCTASSSFPVFLRTLSGRTVVLTAVGNSIPDLLQRIGEVTQIPQHHWYCHVNGSLLSPDSSPHCLYRDCTIVMCARLKGGAPTIPGEWFCQVCQRGGCWPARTHCFRCGQKKGATKFQAPPRERQALGRASPAQGTASCPTERRPAPAQESKKPPNNKLNQKAILAALKTMNIPVELMQQLQATLDPPAPPEIPAKRMLDLQIKLDRAEKERDRLKNVQDKKQEELMHAQMRLDAKMNEVREVLAAIEAVKKEMDLNISAPPPAVQPIFETGAMDEEESPEDGAYLGLNHEHFPAMEVGEIGAPLGTSKRPRQSLEVDPTPSFDVTANAIASYDSDQIQQLLQIAQMQLDTKAAASQLCG